MWPASDPSSQQSWETTQGKTSSEYVIDLVIQLEVVVLLQQLTAVTQVGGITDKHGPGCYPASFCFLHFSFFIQP